jgi:hypothetical protein
VSCLLCRQAGSDGERRVHTVDGIALLTCRGAATLYVEVVDRVGEPRVSDIDAERLKNTVGSSATASAPTTDPNSA